MLAVAAYRPLSPKKTGIVVVCQGRGEGEPLLAALD